jgi:hypothetical protein
MTDFYKTPAQLAEEALEVKAGMTLAALVVAVAVFPVQAFVLMLVMGALHGIAAVIPAVGFGTAVLLTAGVDLLALTLKKFRK